MATHSIILAWRVSWTEEPGGLQSRGLQSPTWLNRNMIHVKKKKKKEQTSVKNSQSLMSLVSLRFLSPGPVFWKVRIY